MSYCKMYELKEDVDCVKCSTDNELPNSFCCLEECGEHEFCKNCKKMKDPQPNKLTKESIIS